MIKFKSLKHYYLQHQDTITSIMKIILVGLFALVEWTLGYRFFAIFIICFFIGAILFQNRHYYSIIIIPILVYIIFNSSVVNNLLVIKNAINPLINHPKSVLVNLFSPNTGLEVLPIPVQNMLSMLHSNSIDSFKLSDVFAVNPEITQRIVESAWPKKLVDNSPYVFITTNEADLYKNCLVIDDSEDLTLVDCH